MFRKVSIQSFRAAPRRGLVFAYDLSRRLRAARLRDSRAHNKAIRAPILHLIEKLSELRAMRAAAATTAEVSADRPGRNTLWATSTSLPPPPPHPSDKVYARARGNHFDFHL